ncbi:MAG: hypothetical protein J0M00_13045 [Burkholderiales bacterium]|nr:hypothetical protein [Burkholderiales bacterium]
MPSVHRPPKKPRRGVAALVVVMMLFFIISLVAAYASRNLIFEQRTSANNYRSTQAFDAAEAGLEWAVAMLNGGRIDDACTSTADPARDSFRERYLQIVDDTGRIDPRKWNKAGADVALQPSCVLSGGAWVCSCPSGGDPQLVAPAGTGNTPVFRVEFAPIGVQPHLFRVFVRGCSNWGTPCIDGAANRADANAEVNAVLGLAPALTQTPIAAVTVRGPLDAPSAEVVNPDTVGLAINAGGAIAAPPVVGPAGMPSAQAQAALVVPDDLSLNNLPVAGAMTQGEMLFLAAFGMPPDAYRLQASVRRIVCGDDCGAAIQDTALRFPGHAIWIDGDWRLSAGTVLDLGTAAVPALIIVGGNIDWAAGASVVIRGLVHVRGASWSSAGAAATVVGAVVAEGDPAGPPDAGRFTVTGSPRFVYDAALMDTLKKVQARTALDFASFTRLPGSWRDFR